MQTLRLEDLFPEFEDDDGVPSYHLTPQPIHIPDNEPPPSTPPVRQALIPGERVRVVDSPASAPEPEIPEEVPPATLPPSPSCIRTSLEELRQRWRQRWQEEKEQKAEQERRAAYEQGWEAGYAQARQEYEAEIEQVVHLVTRGWDTLQTRFTEELQRIERPFLEALFAMVEQLLQAPLPEAMQETIRNLFIHTIENLEPRVPATIHLSEEEYQWLQEQGYIVRFNQHHPRLQWMVDPLLQAGEWRVESPEAIVTRELDHLLHTFREELGLSSDAPDEEAS